MTDYAIILTGETGAGKTTACAKLLRQCLKEGISCGGILQPAIFQDSAKVGSLIMSVADGETELFVYIREKAQFEGEQVGKYVISERGLGFAAQALDSSTACDVVFVDEVGPLELRGRGLMQSVEKIMASEKTLVFVVRKKILAEFKKKFSKKKFRVIKLTRENRNNTPEKMLALIKKKSAR